MFSLPACWAGYGIIKSADEGELEGALHTSGRQDLKWLMGKVAVENSIWFKKTITSWKTAGSSFIHSTTSLQERSEPTGDSQIESREDEKYDV